MMTEDDTILFEVKGHAGVITLNKPATLNAVTASMLVALDRQLDIWEADRNIRHVIIKAVQGRAFSAGGDIRHLYDEGTKGNFDYAFFAHEYALNTRIHLFPKPYIALIDGIAMGGGVGISFHGSHRVAGDSIAFAMPEVGIGFFPDVGGSYLLSRLPGKLGLYLGLTGQRLKQADCVWCGLATHACASDRLDELEAALCQSGDIDAVLNDFDKPLGDGSVIADLSAINKAFDASTLPEAIANLKTMAASDDPDGDWATKTLRSLEQKSPTSLMIAWRQITDGAGLSMPDCMRMEYRILRRILSGSEFYEGIRAAIIDKDNAPQWQPSTLENIDIETIDAHFEPMGDDELRFRT